MDLRERNIILIVLFVVVFAVSFVVEARQGPENSRQANPLSTSATMGPGHAPSLYRAGYLVFDDAQ